MAKRESVLKILNKLHKSRDGLRFSELKEKTKLHQDTLSKRLKELVSLGSVQHDIITKKYSLSEEGWKDKYTKWLLELIEKATNRVVTGGPEGSSAYPADNLIIKSTIGSAFPSINVSSVIDITKVVHKYYMIHTLYWLARNYQIDPRYLIGEKPLEGLVEELKNVVKPRKQVLAFVIDHEAILENLNADYLKEIIRIATIEDKSGIERRRQSNYMSTFQKHAMELKILEIVQQHEKVNLKDLARELSTSTDDVEKIADGLLVGYTGPTAMEVYDQKGRFIREVQLWPQEKEIKTPDGLVLKMRTKKSKAFLKKTVAESTSYYEIASQKE